jgi:hypothetical protein
MEENDMEQVLEVLKQTQDEMKRKKLKPPKQCWQK